ncbi:MAG: hypothetical protein IKQ49_04910 [Eubacterium sp.]|nr:hypothetical protein [Eubacterium sp.]
MIKEMSTIMETLRKKVDLEKCARLGAERIYGAKLPKEVEDRLTDELQGIRVFGHEGEFISTYLAVQIMDNAGEYHLARGAAGASLVNYFLGITSVNPLPPHYRCPHCKYAEFLPTSVEKGENVPSPSGFDLISPYQEKVSCPKCGHFMVGDGHSLPAGFFYGTAGEKAPGFELDVRPAFGEWFRENAAELLGEEVASRIRFREVGKDDEEGAESKETGKSYLIINLNPLLKDTRELERRTGILFRSIPIDGISYNDFFENEEYKDIPLLCDIPEENVAGTQMLCFSDVVKQLGEMYGTFQMPPIPQDPDIFPVLHPFIFREDIALFLMRYGIKEDEAVTIAENVGKGKTDRKPDLLDQAYLEAMGVPEAFCENIEGITYLFSRAHETEYAIFLFRLMWFRNHFPKTYLIVRTV